MTGARRTIAVQPASTPIVAKNIDSVFDASNYIELGSVVPYADEVILNTTQRTSRRQQILALDFDLNAITKKQVIENGSNSSYGMGTVFRDGMDYWVAGMTYLNSRYNSTYFKVNNSFIVQAEQRGYDISIANSFTRRGHIIKTASGVYTVDGYASTYRNIVRYFNDSLVLQQAHLILNRMPVHYRCLAGITTDSAGNIIVAYTLISDYDLIIEKYTPALVYVAGYRIATGRFNFNTDGIYTHNGHFYILCAMRNISHDVYQPCVIKVAEDFSSFNYVVSSDNVTTDSSRVRPYGGGVKSNGNVVWAGVGNTGAGDSGLRLCIMEFDSNLDIVRQIEEQNITVNIDDNIRQYSAGVQNNSTFLGVGNSDPNYFELFRFDEPDFPIATSPACSSLTSWINSSKTFEKGSGTPSVDSTAPGTDPSSEATIALTNAASGITQTSRCEF